MQTEFTTHKPGTFSWVDLSTTNTAAAKEFYSDLFGWEIMDIPYGESSIYTFLNINGRPAAALAQQQQDELDMGIPPHWLNYVSVENAAATISKVRELGGKVLVDTMDVMDQGKWGLFADPEGAVLGLWQPLAHKGAAYKNIPGSLAWVEHGGHGNDEVIPFYEKLFGWTSKAQDMGGTTYTTFFQGDEWVGGRFIMPAGMEQVPANWLTYFATDNIDGLLEKCRKNGAQILLDKMFIEGMGYYSVIQDPQGAVFGVVEFKM